MNISIYLPQWLLNKLKREAIQEHRTLSGYIRHLVSVALSDEDYPEQPPLD